MNIQLVSNAGGKVMAVQIPIKEWEKIERKLAAFNITESVKIAYSEMLQIENGGLKAKYLEQFLNEI